MKYKKQKIRGASSLVWFWQSA